MPLATNNKLHERGFTLVELLVTISIIGILASITVVSVGNVRQLARDSKRLADIRQLQTGLEFYFSQTNSYPNPGQEIQVGVPERSVLCVINGSNVGFTDTTANCDANRIYMSRVPQNPTPPLNNDYKYSASRIVDNRATGYAITFKLETDIAGFEKQVDYEATAAGIRKK